MIGYKSPEAIIGAKYEGWQDAAVIAKKIRADFKEAKKAGLFPADVKVSVRCQKYAGGQSIKACLSGWEREAVSEEYSDDSVVMGYQGRRMTEKAQMVQRKAREIVSAYNRNASDAMIDYFDVTYYSNADWDYTLVW